MMVEKKSETSAQDPSNKPVIDLLTSILDEFKKQVQSNIPAPLGEKAAKAVAAFDEISDALNVKAAESSFQPAPRAKK
jgi:hypothetical protein